MISPDHPDPLTVDILDPECHPAVGVEILGVVVAKSVRVATANHVMNTTGKATRGKNRYIE